MSDFKLKPKIKVEYDRRKLEFKFSNWDFDSHKKLTSRAFATISGSNKWESAGKGILERFRMIEKEEIDPYYAVRGDIAEMLVYNFMKKHYKENKNIDIELATWDKEKINYDNFNNNKKFGGMIDIAIKSPERYRAVIEVKSKSIKDLELIKKNRGNKEEIMQGLFLSYLSKVDKCLMTYVFFTPAQERLIKEAIRNDKNIGYPFNSKMLAKEVLNNIIWTYTKYDIIPFKHLVSNYEMDFLVKSGYEMLENFKATHTIAEQNFSVNEVKYLISLATGEEERPF